jgi:hypothetical protein
LDQADDQVRFTGFLRSSFSARLRIIATIWNFCADRVLAALFLGWQKVGLGRGRLKLLFSQLWNRINGDRPVDLIYQNLKLRLQPRQNTIESKIMFSAKQREGVELALIKRHLGRWRRFCRYWIQYWILRVECCADERRQGHRN